MNNTTRRFFVFLISALTVFNVSFAAGKPKKEVYIPMDYSTCGYHASETIIPNVKNVITVNAESGDSYASLQRAINYVASLKADKNGHRGAILLGKGIFRIRQPLRISTSGIVLRGMGRNKTTILKTGVERGALIYIEGGYELSGKDTLQVAENKIVAGSTSLTLAQAGNIQSGDRILIVRPSTIEWMKSLNCDDFGGGLSYTGWHKGDIDITYDRMVTATDGINIQIDAPLTTTIDTEYGNIFIVKGHNNKEIK